MNREREREIEEEMKRGREALEERRRGRGREFKMDGRMDGMR